MKIILFFTFSIFTFSTIFSQEINIKTADELLGNNDVEKALALYQEKLVTDQNNPEYLLCVGYSLMCIPDKKESSIAYLQSASDIFKSKKSTISYLESQFYLATAYRKLYRYQEALAIFETLLKENKKRKEFAKIVENEIQNCKSGEILINDTLNVSVKNLKIFNSRFSDHSPVLSNNENEIIFTSKRKNSSNNEKYPDGQYSEDIYISKKMNNKWKAPLPISNNINDATHNANCGLSFDGKTLYIYREDDIYESLNSDNQWNNPVLINIPVNSKFRESDICINETGDFVIFSSNREGGFGGMDLYKTSKSPEGNWSLPENLGNTINTALDENGVFLHPDGTLFFSSQEHNSLGGFDIFSSKPDGNGSFGQPVNIGFPINSAEDDLSFYMSADKKRGYFASERSGGLGHSDIYMVDFADSSKKYLIVKGLVKKNDQSCEGISVTFSNLNTGKQYDNTIAQTDGSYLSVLKKGQDYFVALTAAGCLFETQIQKAPKDTLKEKRTIPVILQKIVPDNVTKKYTNEFTKNSEQINQENELFLNTLANFLTENKELTVDISCGNGEQKDLDNKRVETIVKYLKDKGITENRIFTNIFPVDSKSNTAQFTVLDKNSRLTAFNEKVNNFVIGKNDKPDSGNLLKGNYTIQIGAFSKKLEKSNPYFKKIGGKVKIFLSNDKLFRYTFGKYTYMTDAEKNLLILHKLGYKDAFIRDINWYKTEAE